MNEQTSSITIRQAVLALGIGLFAGVFSGLLGVGGGVLMVPAMVFWLGFTQHRAHGTSLAVILFIAGAGLVSYLHAGQMNWGAALGLAVGGIFGAAIGARLAHRVSAHLLRRYFGVFIMCVAVRMLYDVVVVLLGHASAMAVPVAVTLSAGIILFLLAIGLVTGIVSGLLGVGGGIIMVPTMVLLLGFPQTLAQGISLAVIIPTAISGALVHHRHGNIRFRDVIMLSLGGVFGALAGSWGAVHINALILRLSFSLLLLVLGFTMAHTRRQSTIPESVTNAPLMR